MVQQRVRDTKPEMQLRRALHAMGLRYRVDIEPIPGLRRRADIVFRQRKIAVFVHGCWWHGCTQHRGAARANGPWWAAKLEENRRRDEDTLRRLAKAGWMAVVAWEHDDPHDVAVRIAGLIRDKDASGGVAFIPDNVSPNPPAF